MIQNDESDNGEEIMLPGFRFHPTDEELVSFYLRRKIQQKPLTIELIKQLDIYKYDPWDLPKMATTGEKEWYFYCPRDRKYRNSARPNRVTRAGFWKATGTDRPVYSSDGSRCIGLKKSLVFYQGRAAKGMKTDWMMHEFRLPTLTNSMAYKRPIEKNLPANDSWAICRIFKKTSSNAHRALSHSCVSSSPEITTPDNYSATVLEASSSNQLSCSSNSNNFNICDFPLIDIPFYKPNDPAVQMSPFLSFVSGDLPLGFTTFSTLDTSPALFTETSNNSDSLDFTGMRHQYCDNFPLSGNMRTNEEDAWIDSLQIPQVQNQLENFGPVEFPITLCGEWRPDLPWELLSCPTDLPLEFPNNSCYT